MRPPFTLPDTEALSPEQIAALKQRERTGRDAGASSYLERIGSRGPFRLRAEDLTLLRHVAPRFGQRVLDAGSGVGRHSLLLAPRVSLVTCVDFSEQALRVLAAEARRRAIANLELRTADVCDLPADLGTFDTVVSSEVLQHVPSEKERLKALRGFHRVLHPGGRCVVNVVCWNRRVREAKDGFWSNGGTYCHYFTPAELRAMLELSGFRRVSLHGLLITPGSLTRRLPSSLAYLESALSSFSFMAGAGRFLIGVGFA